MNFDVPSPAFIFWPFSGSVTAKGAVHHNQVSTSHPSLPNPQPSDGQCPCPPGYQDVGEPRGCVQRERKSCKGGATWNQDGLCLTKGQWSHHCAHEVGGVCVAHPRPFTRLFACPAPSPRGSLLSIIYGNTDTCALCSKAGERVGGNLPQKGVPKKLSLCAGVCHPGRCPWL